MRVHFPVLGSQISVFKTAERKSPSGLVISPPPGSLYGVAVLVPAPTHNVPSPPPVAFCCRRLWGIDSVNRQAGLAAVRSITSAVSVGGKLPPRISTLPGSYMTQDP